VTSNFVSILGVVIIIVFVFSVSCSPERSARDSCSYFLDDETLQELIKIFHSYNGEIFHCQKDSSEIKNDWTEFMPLLARSCGRKQQYLGIEDHFIGPFPSDSNSRSRLAFFRVSDKDFYGYALFSIRVANRKFANVLAYVCAYMIEREC
jgi:hypothetical protein